MHNSSKLLNAFYLSAAVFLTGCTTINAGLQSGDLPPNGTFVAENGIRFNVQPLNLATLPPKQVAVRNNDVSRLIQSSRPVDYRIADGDILSIVLVGYPDIAPSSSAGSSNPYAAGYPVDQQGFIQFPMIGRIKASGLSVPQFTNNLRGRLQKYLKYSDPQVKVVNYRGNKFFIDGEVRQPGEFNIEDAPVSLYGAISMAGGATTIGDSNNIILNRKGQSYSLGLQSLREMGSSANQIYLQDGDSVHVNSQSRNRVFVLGEFGRIEPIPILEQGLSLSSVLGESRGLNASTADAAKIYIVRDNKEAQFTNIYYVDMQTITSFALANRFEMQPNDIVYVDPTGLTRWNRVISALLPSTSAARLISGI
ncbi:MULTISPECIES: polysaccharide biosynthesis/export family protein [unclassified Psychrobacter]|uniref:polysaccharide biosynthesis/export family protein n=1 Tax=unclassified Psychrobacter TaxID=196806 RepID=UPI00078BBD75|nr:MULTISPECIES: polysaccharide biosynthesis/export family protein [unclassified Psychrobacter]AMN50841.1 sugar ABC transporter substrate-binding protein [Psychrobacter sp. P2G3]AMN68743.1 sugar ABC transporter substrate-binding protein [Psychrobacter sp. P11G5]